MEVPEAPPSRWRQSYELPALFRWFTPGPVIAFNGPRPELEEIRPVAAASAGTRGAGSNGRNAAGSRVAA